ncbi:transposase, partial [Synechococcus sp. R60.1]
ALGVMLRALRDTAFLFGLRPANANGNGQNAIASPLSSNAQQCSA